MIRRKVEILILVFALGACVTKAQSQVELTTQLDQQLSAFQISMDDLYEYRGILYESGPVDHKLLIKALHYYNGMDLQPNSNQKESAGLLFYFYSNETLHAWLIALNSPLVHCQHRISSSEMMNIERDLKQALGTDYQDLGLVQHIRGTRLSHGTDDTSFLESANRRACNVLFPRAITDSITAYGLDYLNVIPALNIASIPLYCLRPYDSEGYLIDSLCLNIAYSIDHFITNTLDFVVMLENMGARQRTLVFDPGNPIIVGDPFSGPDCEHEYAALPGARSEAAEVAKVFNVQALLGPLATKESLMMRLPGSDFIYLATHGYADPVDPLNGYVLLASGKMDSCDYWTARDIQEGKMTEDIVVLSACQTGVGKAHSAGIIGISRAFIIAGAWNVVMSLWSVDDEATKNLMLLFVNQLFIPHHYFPAGNLRSAILEYKKSDPNPAYWGSFISMGNPYPPGTVGAMKRE